MSDVEITVRGRYSAFRPAERATVRARVALEGPTSEAVYTGVAGQAQQVAESVRRLHDPEQGPVTWWSSDQLRTWSTRPKGKDGQQLALVHHARVDFQVKFRDFAALSSWLGQLAVAKGFTVEGIDWGLTEAQKRELTGQVRAYAVRNAREKAQAYAEALGLGPVHPVAVADAGMLRAGAHPTQSGAAAFSRGAAAPAPALDLAPRDIEVGAEVDVVFTAAPLTIGAAG